MRFLWFCNLSRKGGSDEGEKKLDNRAGELLGMGGCIFLMEPETCGCGMMRPLGVRHLKGKLGAFGSLSQFVFPGGKTPTELASESLKPCLTFAKEGVGYMAWEWIRISLDSRMVVLMVLVQKGNRTSPCLKSYGPCLIFFGTKRTHSCKPGVKGKLFFWNSQVVFVVSADRRLVRIYIYKFVLYIFTHINLYVNLFFIQFRMYKIVYTNLYTLICICKSFWGGLLYGTDI